MTFEQHVCSSSVGMFYAIGCLLLMGFSITHVYFHRDRDAVQKAVVFNPTVAGRVIFGHVHMAKTAGTTLNGRLAARFERVCGHKGYSYDFWQVNERVKRRGSWGRVQDSLSTGHTGYNRGRVHPAIMEEIGYEDCDYVSHELEWQFWPMTFKDWAVPIELHIPCRDPISHLMSMCNYKKIAFDCRNDLEEEVERCLLHMDRFSMKLTRDFKNIRTKCFEAQQIDTYVEYMSQKLQTKRFPAQYVFRPTNTPRSDDSECIWRNSTALALVERYMEKIEYYRFCSSCLGSDDDLLHDTRI